MFVPRRIGTYKLEIWDAQGRWNENAGGVGAYSLGYIDLTEFTTFYVNVGGNRGYNGGGASYIGNNILYNKAMYCYNCTENSGSNTYTVSTYGTTTHASERDTTNCPDGYSSNPISKCAKSGDGYVRITYISN